MVKKLAIPLDFKYDFAMRSYTFLLKGFLYAIREEYGAAAALKLYEKVCKMGDRAKGLTNTLLNLFKIEGNDAETIGKWYDIWWACTGTEGTLLERSKTINRVKVTKCPFKTDPKDLSDFGLIWNKIVTNAINPKASLERPKAMCVGDPYCEYVWRIEE